MNSCELQETIRNSDGHKFVQRIRHFSVSTSIFGSNHLKFELDPENFLKLQQRQGRQNRENGQLETVRLMHNFERSFVSEKLNLCRSFICLLN
jgi:hypothetical protein